MQLTPPRSSQHQKLLIANPQLRLGDFFLAAGASSAPCSVSQGCWGFAGRNLKLTYPSLGTAGFGRWKTPVLTLQVGLSPHYPHLLINAFCIGSFPSPTHFATPAPTLQLPRITSHVNHLPPNPCFRISFWGTQTKINSKCQSNSASNKINKVSEGEHIRGIRVPGFFSPHFSESPQDPRWLPELQPSHPHSRQQEGEMREG